MYLYAIYLLTHPYQSTYLSIHACMQACMKDLTIYSRPLLPTVSRSYHVENTAAAAGGGEGVGGRGVRRPEWGPCVPNDLKTVGHGD